MMTNDNRGRRADPPEIPQLKLGTILFLFAWPAAWYMFLIYVLVRQMIPAGGTTPTWMVLLVTVLGCGAELAVGLALLRREGYCLGVYGMRERIRWRWPQGGKAWTVAVLVFLLGLSVSLLAGPVNQALASVPGFAPPDWWGPLSNPTVEIKSTADALPDVDLRGNFLFVLIYFLVGLVFNIFGEEIYYRGYLLPRMRGVFGRWDWVANGVLFTLKHFYQRWLYPGILAGGLSFAFAAGPLGSLPLAMVYHWMGNFLIPTVFLLLAALGIR